MRVLYYDIKVFGWHFAVLLPLYCIIYALLIRLEKRKMKTVLKRRGRKEAAKFCACSFWHCVFCTRETPWKLPFISQFSFLIIPIFSVTSANGLRTCPSIFLPRLLLDPVSPWFIINLLIWFVSAVAHYTAQQVLFNFSPFYSFRVLTSLVFTSLKIIKIQWSIANATAVPKSYQRHFSFFPLFFSFFFHATFQVPATLPLFVRGSPLEPPLPHILNLFIKISYTHSKT